MQVKNSECVNICFRESKEFQQNQRSKVVKKNKIKTLNETVEILREKKKTTERIPIQA